MTLTGRLRRPEPPLLEARGLLKRFPGVLANDDVNFGLRRGEVHALLGENGAGKSTLMNVFVRARPRRMLARSRVDGEPVAFRSPRTP